MTWEQWVFEYEALREKERSETTMVTEIMKQSTWILREVLVQVLGLDVLAPKELSGKVRPPDAPSRFVPAAFVMGNHHLLDGLLKEHEASESAEKALADTAFEALSSKLARGDLGDIEPMFLNGAPPTDRRARWSSPETQSMLAALGVHRRDGPTDTPDMPHVALTPGIMFEGEE